MDELVKRLREHGEFLIVSDRMKAPPNVNVRNVFAEDYAQAADAIEQLSNAGSAYRRGWILGYDAGRAESKQRWIPVTERLPEHTNLVLVRHRSETGSKFFGLDVFDGYGWVVCLNVTHWMPLPMPPKEEI